MSVREDEGKGTLNADEAKVCGVCGIGNRTILNTMSLRIFLFNSRNSKQGATSSHDSLYD